MTQYIGGVLQGSGAAPAEVVETNATTGTIDNLAIGATTTILRFSGTVSLSGIVAAAARVLVLEVVDGGSLTWEHEGLGSTDAYRLDGLGTASLAMGTRGGAVVAYDPTSQRWRCVGKSV